MLQVWTGNADVDYFGSLPACVGRHPLRACFARQLLSPTNDASGIEGFRTTGLFDGVLNSTDGMLGQQLQDADKMSNSRT